MPRKLVFQNFDASGLPESVFFKFFELRDSPTVHFHKKQLVGHLETLFSEFQPFGMPRSTIFPFFHSSPVSFVFAKPATGMSSDYSVTGQTLKPYERTPLSSGYIFNWTKFSLPFLIVRWESQ